MRLTICLLLLTVLSACASIPESSHYLLPFQPTTSHGKHIKVLRINLPDYIDHKDIILEMKDGPYHRANFHKPTERLDAGIRPTPAKPEQRRYHSHKADDRAVPWHGIRSGNLQWQVAT